MKKLLLSVLLLFTMVSSAIAQEAQPTSQQMQVATQEVQTITKEQAIEIATQYVINNEISMDTLSLSDFSIFDEKKGWVIFFETKKPILGGDFSVIVSPDGKTVTGGGSM